ncbi:hypothetical protein NEOLI_003696 [Neolecta irregularis DAH-3]|uniref:Uncharacterized protein n=1 Tax=Neolecta irregularis (strain DAH-3) TaxID=1198029 RepID=A0A1U7LUC3_NEOID|nr:hypothetical protein NEOLI_003696 [Neolecta irregularis DAH-3]|eukprot:OLL26276.1 hypothetical protein NEOLI_003696 [Neolecta irregularis DAH-3]
MYGESGEAIMIGRVQPFVIGVCPLLNDLPAGQPMAKGPRLSWYGSAPGADDGQAPSRTFAGEEVCGPAEANPLALVFPDDVLDCIVFVVGEFSEVDGGGWRSVEWDGEEQRGEQSEEARAGEEDADDAGGRAGPGEKERAAEEQHDAQRDGAQQQRPRGRNHQKAQQQPARPLRV